MKYVNYILFVIILIAGFLRLWNLGNYPALNADEAAIGYNAYSLLETGKDEHGNSWPVHFQSFNDYKPGFYFYLVLPFIKIFGINEWTVRLPNALLGVLNTYLIYLLVTNLFYKSEKKVKIALVSAFFLAINPWHIHFSRGGWEVNTATFLITLGVYFYIRFVNGEKYKNRPLFLILSFISFVLSLYTYHAARIVTPLMILGFLGIYYLNVIKNYKYYLICGLFALICLFPLVADLLKPDISSRVAGVGLFADVGPINRTNEQRGEHLDYNSLLPKILHNKISNYLLTFFDNWLEHYHGLFLFLSGDDIQRNKVPETGQMYLTDLLWVIIGFWWLVKNINREVKLVFYWLLIAPIAAALTFQSPHALRSENMVIPLVIIASVGFTYSIDSLRKIFKNGKILNIIHISVFLLILFQFLRYLHMYWAHMSKEYPYSSQYGAKELVEYVLENENKYKNIVITTKYDQPYILFLFYDAMTKPSRYSAERFQTGHVLSEKDQYGFSTVNAYGKYVFKQISWDFDRLEYPNSMIVGTPTEIPKEANIIKRIYGSNNFEYYNAVAN